MTLPPFLGANAGYALFAAIAWGGGDFAGGMAVKRAGGILRNAFRLVLLSHGLSFVVLILLAHARADPFPHGAPLAWGLGAGVTGGIAILTFYLCLARGAMGIPAALSGLLAAAIPALLSAFLEGAPALTRLFGFGLAAAAIVLIAAGPPTSTAPAVPRLLTVLPLLAGAGFGLFFIALRYAGAAGVLWPMALSRVGSLSVCLLGILLTRGSATTPPTQPAFTRDTVRWALLGSVLDTSGTLSFIASSRAGRLDIAAVLASLYPASTILLAAWLLRERPSARQLCGMAVALAAVLLITL